MQTGPNDRLVTGNVIQRPIQLYSSRNSRNSGCYRDPDDMANVERLQVTYRITFNRDGTLMRPPKRTRPMLIPPSDQQLKIFDDNAQRAIRKCEPYSDIFKAADYEAWKDVILNFGKK